MEQSRAAESQMASRNLYNIEGKKKIHLNIAVIECMLCIMHPYHNVTLRFETGAGCIWKLVKFETEQCIGDMVLFSTKNHFSVLNYSNSSIYFCTTIGLAIKESSSTRATQ